MKNLQQLSRKLGVTFEIVFWLTPLALLTFLIIMMFTTPENALQMYNPLHHSSDASKRLLFCSILASYIPAIPFMIGLKHVVSLLKNYQAGNVFTRANAKSYRSLSHAILAWVLLGVVGSTLATLIITLNNGPGKHILGITFVGSDVIALVLSGVFMLLSWVMLEAQTIADENAKTI